MKKILYLCLSLTLFFTLFSCSESKENDKNEHEKEKVCSHQWVEATCQSPKKCSLCGVTSGTKSESHTYEADRCKHCGLIKPTLYNTAINSLEKEGYHIEEISMDWFNTEVSDGQAFAAMTGVPEKEWSDLDGDALYLAEDMVWALYLENDKDAELFYDLLTEFAANGNKFMEEEVEDDADYIVKKTFICVKKGLAVYFGTENAINIAQNNGNK